MPFVEWKDKYCLGHEVVDQQHQTLFAILNELAEAGFEEKQDAAYTCLSRMMDYAREHFREEENYMREIDYPGLEEHTREHKCFIERVETYKDAVYNTYVPFQDMVEFLNNWLVGHILGSDSRIIKRTVMH